MKKEIAIVGGGAISLLCAYNLVDLGYKITIIDEGDITNNTSFGNAGAVSAFEKFPLASVGVVPQILKKMLKGESPLVIRPQLDPMLYRWLYRFIKNANEQRVKRSVELFEKYGRIAMDGYKAISQIPELDINYNDHGVLLVFTQKESYEARKKVATDPEKYQILSFEETKEYLPFIKENIAGAMVLKRNGYLDPVALMRKMKAYLQKRGVEFVLNTKIEDFEIEGGRVTALIAKDREFRADTFILSTGAKLELAKKLGNDFIMIPAKGHSVTFTMREELIPKKAAIFNDIFTFMTPYKDRVRLTSKLELNVADNTPDPKMIEKIIRSFKRYTVDFEMYDAKIWAGNRPLTPNDMPLIGRDKRVKNVIHATGLGWLGITFAPAIGKIISTLIDKELENEESEDIMSFSGMYQ